MRHSRQSIASLLIIILLASSLSGCWDRRELEEQAFVLTIGVDKGPVKGSYIWTFQIAIPRALAGGGGQSGGGGGGQKSSTNVSVVSTTLFGALNLMNSFIDRKANLMHAKVIIVSEEVARLDPLPLRALIRYREIRRNLFVMIAEGTAKEIITSYRPIIEQNPAKFIETLILNSSFTGLMPKTQLHEYLTDLESRAIQPTAILVGKSTGTMENKKPNLTQTAPYLPGDIPREGGGSSELIGVAVFRGLRMVGKLTGSDNRMMAMLNGNFRRGYISFPDPQVPGKFVALDVRAGSPPVIKVDWEKGKPVISIRLHLEADILLIQSNIDYTRLDMLTKLEDYATDEITQHILEVIHKTQAMQADIFGFGNKARHLVNTWDQWEKLNWSHLYPQAETRVNVEFSIRRIGVEYQPVIPNT